MMNKQEFSNERLAILVDQKEGCHTLFEITASPKLSTEAFKKATKQVSKEVSFPGFRKGKAPEALVLQKYKAVVDKEWKDLLLNNAFQEALSLTNIYPFRKESVKKASLNVASLESDSKIVVEFEAFPTVPSVQIEELTVSSKEPAAVTQEEIDRLIREVRLHHAVWKEVEERGVQEGDFVDLDIEAIDPDKGSLAKDMRFEVKKEVMPNWLRDLVLEKKQGDVVEGMSKQEKPLHDEDCQGCQTGEHPAFQPTLCKVTIKKILTADMPPIDDELAKKTGVADVKTMLERAQGQLEKAAKEEAHRLMQNQIEKLLLEKYPFDLPDSLIKAELNHIQYDLKNAENAEDTVKKIVEELRFLFLVQKIATDHQIQVSKDELVRAWLAEYYSKSKEEQAAQNPEKVWGELRHALLSQKVKAFLLEKVMAKT